MCTLSWVPSPEGYALAFNRDERRLRAAARPPERRDIGGVPVLTPIDGEAGGSWIAVNAYGHTVSLLNRWEDTPVDAADSGALVSRGLLVLALAPLTGPVGVAEALASMPLVRYRPFTVVSVAPDAIPEAFEWNGRTLARERIEGPGLLRTSSGADQRGAERARGEVFRTAIRSEGGLTPGVLEALHRTHLPSRGALSICMHRDDAVTVSASFIEVRAGEIRFRYVDGSPCEAGPPVELGLPRAPGRGA